MNREKFIDGAFDAVLFTSFVKGTDTHPGDFPDVNLRDQVITDSPEWDRFLAENQEALEQSGIEEFRLGYAFVASITANEPLCDYQDALRVPCIVEAAKDREYMCDYNFSLVDGKVMY